jgi:hypothetical protein
MKKSLLFLGSVVLPCYLSAQTIGSNKPDLGNKDTVALHSADKNVVHPGLPGIGMSNRVMGTSVLNLGSNPLVVVNGVPWQNISAQGFDFTTADERDYATLIGIPVDEIGDIAITTDAFTTAQYGVRAANGVILISTRRGTTGAPKISFKTESSVQYQPKGYEVLNGDEYIMTMREEFHNAYGMYNLQDPAYLPIAYDKSYKDFYNYSQNTDWLRAITRLGYTRDLYMAVSGGVKYLDYHVSLGIPGSQGNVFGNKESRFLPRLILDSKICDQLKISLDISYSHTTSYDNYWVNGHSIQEVALKKMPNMSIYEMDSLGNKTGNYFTPSTNFQGSASTYYNPVAMVNLAENETRVNRTRPVFLLTFTPIPALEYNFRASFEDVGSKYSTFISPNVFTNTSSSAAETNLTLHSFQTWNQIIFKPELGEKHHLVTQAIFSTNSQEINSMSVLQNLIPSNVIISDSVFGMPSYLFSSITEYNYYYLNLGANYTFLNKYTISISGIKEHYTNYSSKRIYPAVTLQWDMVKEPFMKHIPFVNYFSINASYGEFKNRATWVNADENYYQAAFVQKNLGIKMGLFQSRINLSMNLYERQTNDISLNSPVVISYIGYTNAVLTNINTFDKTLRGWEIALNTSILKSKDVSVDFTIDLYRNQNMITGMSSIMSTTTGNPLSPGGYVRTIEFNKPTGDIKGYHSLGVYATDQDVIARDRNGNTILNGGSPVSMHTSAYTFSAGDARYADQNYDGIIDASDLISLGNSNPTLTGSFGPGFRYKSWWLGCYFNFRLHNKMINMARLELEDMSNKDNKSSAVLNRWRAQGQVADIPRAIYGIPFNTLGSDRFVEDGSFLRLKALTLKYELPLEDAKKLGLSNVNFYITCRNLVTFTRYKGADPDIWLNNDWQTQGTDNNYTPALKEFIFGISFGL